MTTRARAVTLVAVLGASLAALPGHVRRGPSTQVIEIRDMAFHPPDVRVRPGDTMVWINRDMFPHTATQVDSAWASPTMAPGASWRLVAARPGDIAYLCAFHPTMRGHITVAAR